MLPKIIVTTGCSYGVFFESFKKFGNIPGAEIILDLHAISLGSTFQSLSIIETVDKLLKAGEKAEDIFVLAEFSQLTRRDIIIQNELFIDELENTNVFDEESKKIKGEVPYPLSLILNENNKNLELINKITEHKFHASNFPKFKNYYITNPESGLKNFPNKLLSQMFSYYDKNVTIYDTSLDICNVEAMSRALTFFENLLFVETFLKKNNIKYKFCLMQNQFSLWDYNGKQEDLRTIEIDNEHYLNQDYKNSKQIWDINNSIRIIKDLIDWNNWWFYENKEKNIIWGGIDEYAIDKYGKKAYPYRNNNKNLFHQHPDTFVYDDLIKFHLMKEYFYDTNRFI